MCQAVRKTSGNAAADSKETPSGNVLLVIVEEGLNLLPVISPHRYERKYNREEIWYSLSMRFDFSNFRGRRETFCIGGELWDRKSFSLLWQQPYDPRINPGYLWCQLQAAVWPHPYESYDAREMLADLGAGRFLHSAWSAYTRGSVHDLRTDSLGMIREFIFPRVGMGIIFDSRDNNFRPVRGMHLSTGVDLFGLRVGDLNFPQAHLNWKSYRPLPFLDHYVVVLSETTQRFRRPPYIKRLYGGGNGSVRGYSPGALRGDNSAVFTGEYRLAVWTTPRIAFSYIDYFVPTMNRLYGILEVAGFTDAGLYWDYGESPFHSKWAYAAGIGLRGWVPPLRRSAVLDFAWNRDGEIHIHSYLDISF